MKLSIAEVRVIVLAYGDAFFGKYASRGGDLEFDITSDRHVFSVKTKHGEEDKGLEITHTCLTCDIPLFTKG